MSAVRRHGRPSSVGHHRRYFLTAHYKWAIKGTRPDRWDIAGALLCLVDGLDTTLEGFDSAGGQIRGVFARLEALRPGAVLPTVCVVVGNGISGGTTTRGSALCPCSEARAHRFTEAGG